VRACGYSLGIAAAMLLAAPFASAADESAGWYVGVRAGLANSTLDTRDVSTALAARGHDVSVRIDDEEPLLSAFGGYRFATGLAIEANYLDLGEYDMTLTGSTTNQAALLGDAGAVLADAGRGAGLSLGWRIAVTPGFAITPRIGGYYWDSDREITSNAGQLRRQTHGTDLMGGIELSWRLGASWELGLAWDAFDAASRNDVRGYTASLAYRFGK
jgi:hypothetical protein